MVPQKSNTGISMGQRIAGPEFMRLIIKAAIDGMGWKALIWGVCFIIPLLICSCTEPSDMGRFHATPITNVILEDLGVVDEEPGAFEGARDPKIPDTQPSDKEYVIGSGDVLLINIMDLFAVNMEWQGQRQVSETGRITLPSVGTFLAAGRTEVELTDHIVDLLSPEVLKNPEVSVVVIGSRERFYSISGAVTAPGRYPLLGSNFRLSEAFAQAQGIPQMNADYAYVVRKVLESEDLVTESKTGYEEQKIEAWPAAIPEQPEMREGPIDGEDYIQPEEPTSPQPGKEQDELLESIKPMSVMITPVELAESDVPKPESWIEESQKEEILPPDTFEEVTSETTESVSDKPFKVVREGGGFKLIPAAGSPEQPGDWESPVSALPATKSKLADYGMEEMGGAGQIYDVIRIDLNKLRSGDLTQNIIIQSGDDIQVPYNSVGVFYVGGQVSRPGAYNLTGAQMTLKRAMVSAGPLTSLAWPSRCEISRMIGENREVTYQVNLEKLFAGAAPDIYIKPGDMINVGSHPLARFIAVVRQSFRATYGFGFVYDRNFADKDFMH